MYDYNRLSGLIIEKCKSKRNFAKLMNLSERSIYLKLQGKIEFKQSEISLAKEILDISKDDIFDYFFKKKVQKN
nr:MAG TPA: Protein of unknown function (DUF739) [Caudoviricetes sp.]